jgi:hypothetical protein
MSTKRSGVLDQIGVEVGDDRVEALEPPSSSSASSISAARFPATDPRALRVAASPNCRRRLGVSGLRRHAHHVRSVGRASRVRRMRRLFGLVARGG